MMAESEFISRAAAIAKMHDYRQACLDIENFKESKIAERTIDFLRNIPVADVRPVVFCKDCIHSDTFAPDCTEAAFPLKCLFIRYGGVHPDWFCEHGEKREES